MAKRAFELDLTSVCVTTGVMQLPLKMQEFFVAGDLPAVVDGEELRVSFTEPRRLSGFQQHFEKRGLRCNDKVVFEVEVEGDVAISLVAASIKRERNRPAQQQAAGGAEAADRTDGDTTTNGASSRQRASSWGTDELSGQVRAVRRVRIEGGVPLPVSVPGHHQPHAEQAYQAYGTRAAATSRPTSNDGPDRRSTEEHRFARWAPLDGVSADSYHPPLAEHDFPETTVRAVRRSREILDDRADDDGAGRSEQEYGDVTLASGEVAEFPPLFSQGDEVIDDEPESQDFRDRRPLPIAAAMEQEARPVGETGLDVREPRATVATPRIPVPRNTVAGADWQPTPASDLSPVDPSVVQRQPRLIEERELVPVRAPFEPRSHSQRDEQESFGVERPEAASTVAGRASEVGTGRNERQTIDDTEFGGEYLPAGQSLEAALRSKQQERLAFDDNALPDAPRAGQGTSAGADAGFADAVPVAQGLVPAANGSDANPHTSAQSLPAQGQSPMAVAPRVEDDLRLVESYLSRPTTPAIVRSEVIAAELGIDDQRSERALERLSEDRNRVSRIRKGAYMVKRTTTATSHRL